MTREELNKDIQIEMDKEENKAKRKRLFILVFKITIIVLLTLLIFYSYTTYISTTKTIVREYRITNDKIPTSLSGLKIVQLSDLHYGTTIKEKELKKIVKLSNERTPDIVVFTGDLVYNNYNLDSKKQEYLIKQLKNIKATLGKYAILGDEDKEEVTTIFNQSDFNILKDDYDFIYKEENTPILLIGMTSYLKGDFDINKAYKYFQEDTHNSNIYTITLLHEPDGIDDILSTQQTDLFLAGHSHNGNIRIPFLNTSIFKIKGAKKYDQDYYKVNQSELYISSGLGTKNGIRLFCRPSINFYRLSQK